MVKWGLFGFSTLFFSSSYVSVQSATNQFLELVFFFPCPQLTLHHTPAKMRISLIVALLALLVASASAQRLQLTRKFSSSDCTGGYVAGGPIVAEGACTPSDCTSTNSFSSEMVVCESTVSYASNNFGGNYIMVEYASNSTCETGTDPVSIWGIYGRVAPPPSPPSPPSPHRSIHARFAHIFEPRRRFPLVSSGYSRRS